MVVGFAFDLKNNHLVLVVKDHPQWMAGKLNGVGGKIEAGETPKQAMVREFFEEAGVPSLEDSWQLFHYEQRDDGAKIHFFAADLFGVGNWVRNMTSEPVEVLRIDSWQKGQYRDYPQLYNIEYLVPMALAFLRHPEHRYTVNTHPTLKISEEELSLIVNKEPDIFAGENLMDEIGEAATEGAARAAVAEFRQAERQDALQQLLNLIASKQQGNSA